MGHIKFNFSQMLVDFIFILLGLLLVRKLTSKFFIFIIFCWALIFTSTSIADVTVSLENPAFNSIRSNAVVSDKFENFLNNVLKKLPASFSGVLSKKIQIEFAHMQGPGLSLPQCYFSSNRYWPEPKEGTLTSELSRNESGYAIRLNLEFAFAIIKGVNNISKAPCGYRNLYLWAQAEVIKQVVHIYEATQKHPQSHSIDWEAQAHRLGIQYVDANTETLENLFSTYFSYSRIDADFSCHFPSIKYFFDSTFGTFNEGKSCKILNKVWFTSTGKKANLNLDRLYQVHLIIANPGKNIESRWGHSMFRLVFCAPERKEMNDDCLKDLNYHVALSFLGQNNSIVISTWAGLTGKYPSYLTIEEFSKILNDYTIEEGRDITSYPLELTRLETKLFVMRALEEYWSYQGRYYFLTNNCVTESLHFLQSVTTHRTLLLKEDPLVETPLGFKDLLTRRKIIVDVDNEKYKKISPYFFPSVKKVWQDISSEDSKAKVVLTTQIKNPLENSKNNIEQKSKSTLSKISNIDITEFEEAKNWDPEERKQEFDDFIKGNQTSSKAIAIAFYKRELQIYNNGEQRITRYLQSLLESDPRQVDSTYRKWLDEIQALKLRLYPIQRVNYGYGIPIESELRPEKEADEVSNKINKLKESINSQIKIDRPSLFDDLKYTNENMIYFYSYIKPANSGSQRKEVK